jgi:catalase
VSYFPIHAYKWIAPDGTENWVRYVLAHDPHGARPEGTFEGRDRLAEEIAARLAAGPVRYTLQVSVAGEKDDPHDPTSVWKRARTFDAGTIEVTGVADDPEADGGLVVFDPTRIVDGIELSDDPILQYRAGAYSESASRRAGG